MSLKENIAEAQNQINNLQNQINNLQDIIDNGHEELYNELSALGFQYDLASNEYLQKINERFSLYASREIDGLYRYRVTDSDNEDKNHIEYYDSEDDFFYDLINYQPRYSWAFIGMEFDQSLPETVAKDYFYNMFSRLSKQELLEKIILK